MCLMNNGGESTNAHPSNTATGGAAIRSYGVKEDQNLTKMRQPAITTYPITAGCPGFPKLNFPEHSFANPRIELQEECA
jgi:hypothetical protein